MPAPLEVLLEQVSENCDRNELIKITLGNKKDKAATLKNIFIKPVLLKEGLLVSFVYRNNTNDVTKNYPLNEALQLMKQYLQNDFWNADVFTVSADYHLFSSKNVYPKLVTKPATQTLTSQALVHDHQKQRIIKANNNSYLKDLGIVSKDGLVKKDMQDKYKQINKYVEIVDGIIKDLKLHKSLKVVDMGSGKGYLTFALYDYLKNKLQLTPSITGIEMREDLVDQCNRIANNAGFEQLSFIRGTIAETVLTETDMLIALHACDTATDDAIAKGINANALVILCAPCCHKQIRKQMSPTNELYAITKHGILLERQAEIVTDSIRAILLEMNGYKTRVFDFIASEHTPKNVLIVAVKSGTKNETDLSEKLKGLKQLFNIREHYLETLLNKEAVEMPIKIME